MTIRKLLIANRGEIACRIMRTCRRLGIRTVAVFSDADRDALHVASADEAVRIGPAEVAQSYLNVEAIIEAARRTGADAIHPGYGFLSERVALVERCAEAGIVWVGPSAAAITAMGSKIESKRIAEAAGVPCVPGYHGAAQDDDSLAAAAEAIGFPVLIKASAGGGGRGMRRLEKAEELRGALALARAEAQAGFGDPALLIEKLILRPRHIEVQLAGDKHGNLVHLFERECSIQRNYQKVVEEAPAPNLTAEVRAALFEAALKLGVAIGYDSLGTVEFILDADGGGPWFLEMNTRLQVEHPVTEFITGLDLVEWQIRVADGERLPLAQEAIRASGSAIEARINAEDPAAGYRPSLGTIALFEPPAGEGIRVDTGVRAGSIVSPYYDSLVAKLIAYGPDRAIAAARLSAALDTLAVLGIRTNQAFVGDIVDHPRFRAGELTTRFIPEVFPDGWQGAASDDAHDVAAAAAIWAAAREDRSAAAAPGPWGTLGGFRVTAPAGRPGTISLEIVGPAGAVAATLCGHEHKYKLQLNDVSYSIEIKGGKSIWTVIVDGVARQYGAAVESDRITLDSNRASEDFAVVPRIERAGAAGGRAAEGGAGRVTAPLPGLISQLAVAPGQMVAQGETVIVLEAMKLMYSLSAQISGSVAAVLCAVGDTVAAGATLVQIESEG